ncbi:MAG TPA: LacI family DNA-binding transcriptional regulator, partial [Kofleriaceae bacterium]|nr:LacI family DNA-binding transcriptional regulator [Kofleriaceae bacterium]
HPNVTPETRQRIIEVVDRLRYVPHTTARSLITRRTHVIGVLLPDLYGGFFSELIRGIDAAARELGLHLLLSSSHGDAAEMAAAIRAMRGRVEGLLVLAPQLDAAGVELDAEVPAVFMNSRVDDGVSSSLSIDSYGGARAMVRHLVARGHRTIAHVTGPVDNFDSHERERGYRDELAASLPRARAVVVRGDFTEGSGYTAGRELGARTRARPAAVFAANDVMAIGCLAAFDELGLAVPRDIAVAGFDDIPLAAYVRPALTTMRVPIVELGRGAVERLAAAIAAPGVARPVVRTISVELIVRESCGARPHAKSIDRPAGDGGIDEQQQPRNPPRSRARPPAAAPASPPPPVRRRAARRT